MNRQEFTSLDSTEQDPEEDNICLDLFLPAAKTVGEYEERIKQLPRLYVREAKGISRDN